jgi:Ala-tRNA(Pro) deacylase
LFAGLGGRSWLDETNRQSALLREKLNNWSLLLADVSNWATIRGVPKESGQGNKITTAIFISERQVLPNCRRRSMAIPRNIKEHLFHSGVSYSHKIHPVAFTSLEIAEVDHIPGREFAKTVVLKADDRFIMAVVPGDNVINMNALKRHVGCKRLSLASETEFAEKFPACQPGAMPPFGKLFGLPLYCDSALSKLAEMEFNAGTHIDTVRMKFSSFIKLENPAVLGFSEKRRAEHAARIA